MKKDQLTTALLFFRKHMMNVLYYGVRWRVSVVLSLIRDEQAEWSRNNLQQIKAWDVCVEKNTEKEKGIKDEGYFTPWSFNR